MIKKLFFPVSALVVALSLVGLTFAQGEATTLTGHIIDKACSQRVAKKENPQAAAAAESKGCALMESCAKSGFGVFADGKFYEFDQKGASLAKSALEKTSKDKGAKFKVVGKVSEGKVAVDSITEVE